MDKNQAITATRNGAIAALVSAGLTAFIVTMAILSDAGGKLSVFNDAVNYIDVALILLLSFGMYRKSRVASIVMVVYFVVAKIILATETGSYSGIVVSLIFIYFFARAVQGAFVYHKLEKAENPEYKPAGKWMYFLGIPTALVFVVFLGFALLSTVGVIPSTRVQSAGEIPASDIASLLDEGVIYSDDQVRYFYSQGLTSVLESGNILTQDRVIFYYLDEAEGMLVYEIPVNEITEVTLEQQGDMTNDSVYKVSTADPDKWIKLFLSVEQKGDQKFVSALRSQVAER